MKQTNFEDQNPEQEQSLESILAEVADLILKSELDKSAAKLDKCM
jgi:hypothetical protein